MPGHWSSGMILLQGRRGRGFNSLMPPILDFPGAGICEKRIFARRLGLVVGWPSGLRR